MQLWQTLPIWIIFLLKFVLHLDPQKLVPPKSYESISLNLSLNQSVCKQITPVFSFNFLSIYMIIQERVRLCFKEPYITNHPGYALNICHWTVMQVWLFHKCQWDSITFPLLIETDIFTTLLRTLISPL